MSFYAWGFFSKLHRIIVRIKPIKSAFFLILISYRHSSFHFSRLKDTYFWKMISLFWPWMFPYSLKYAKLGIMSQLFFDDINYKKIKFFKLSGIFRLSKCASICLKSNKTGNNLRLGCDFILWMWKIFKNFAIK